MLSVSCMDSAMVQKVGSLVEPLWAEVTEKWTLPTVNANVVLQASLVTEVCGAQMTCKTVSTVGPHVLL